MSLPSVETTARREPEAMNGVKTPELLDVAARIGAQPELARVTWRAGGDWMGGAHMLGRIEGFAAAGGARMHPQAFRPESDHPAALCGEGAGPTPMEWVLHGLAGCLTAGIANIAAARGVRLDEISVAVEGDMDLRGGFGVSDEVRNGFEGIRVTFRVRGDASPETLAGIVERSRARSAVFDALTNRTPVAIRVDAG
ncbi:OsmC family protein [Albimonas sp. CAU 1670]|uniref:OsmC family protein n=1 Tax=Albimonas sp. CAU 1670 TaxID=3032599 RepID=UPI0023D9E40B|nr:OsmC family protein [Albimonas sp. CAU 1670]MDF2235462.1 OsmC family protein [Albimonas sp. CAU 1670]